MINNLLRVLNRKLLALYTKILLLKHNPNVIGIRYNDNSVLLKEYLYYITSQKFNVRRNLEKADSEFSIPLTVIGTLSYPKSYFEWLKFNIHTFFRLLYIKPYKHFLIVDLNHNNTDLSSYWYKTIKPDLTFQSVSDKRKPYNKFINVNDNDLSDITSGKSPSFLRSFLKYLEMDLKDIDTNYPFDIKQRFNIYPGINNSLIIDARYYYYPPKIKSIVEIAQTLPGNKYVFSDLPIDKNHLPANFKIIEGNKSISHENESVYIFITSRDKPNNDFRSLMLNKLEA